MEVQEISKRVLCSKKLYNCMLKIGCAEDILCGSYDFTNSFLVIEVHMSIFLLLMLILYNLVGMSLVRALESVQTIPLHKYICLEHVIY